MNGGLSINNLTFFIIFFFYKSILTSRYQDPDPHENHRREKSLDPETIYREAELLGPA
jgi:hypothetical protein